MRELKLVSDCLQHVDDVCGQVMSGEVLVRHTGGQGTDHHRLDTMTLLVQSSSQQPPPQPPPPALIDMPLSITWPDTSPPQLLIGSHLVVQVDAAAVSLAPDVISAMDIDTQPHRLVFYVTKTPLYGRLEKQHQHRPVNRRGLLSVCLSVCHSLPLSCRSAVMM